MNGNPRYGGGAIALHWIHALLVIGLITWGMWMADLPKGPERGRITSYNVCYTKLLRCASRCGPNQQTPLDRKFQIIQGTA